MKLPLRRGAQSQLFIVIFLNRNRYNVLGRPLTQDVVSRTYKGGRSGSGKFGFGLIKNSPLMGVVTCMLVCFLD